MERLQFLQNSLKTPRFYDDTFVNLSYGKYGGSLLGKICRAHIYGDVTNFFESYHPVNTEPPSEELIAIRSGKQNFSGATIQYVSLDSPELLVFLRLLREEYRTLIQEQKTTQNIAIKRQRRMEIMHSKEQNAARNEYREKNKGSVDGFERIPFDQVVSSVRAKYLFIDLCEFLLKYFKKGYRLVTRYHLLQNDDKSKNYKRMHLLLVHKDNTRRFISVVDSRDGESALRVNSGYFGDYNTKISDGDNAYRTLSVCSIVQHHIGSQEKLFGSLIDAHVAHEDEFYTRILAVAERMIPHVGSDIYFMKVLIQKFAEVAFEKGDYIISFVERLMQNSLYSKKPTTLIEMVDALYKGREAVHSGGFAGYLEELLQEAKDEAILEQEQQKLSEEDYAIFLKECIEKKKKEYSSMKKGYYASFSAKWKKRSTGNLRKVDLEILEMLEKYAEMHETNM